LANSGAPPSRPRLDRAAARPAARRAAAARRRRRYYDYCTTSRDVTNLGCLCKAVWELPGTNAMHGKPYHNSSGVIIGGKCADAPNPDGSAAGGPWCETVAKTCSNNPKASDVPTYSRDFDYCTSNTAYQAVRERLLPLDRAAAGGLPPIPDTPAYAFARREGVAALGGYISTTQSGCKCSPWSWTYFDLVTGAPNGSYIGCADPDPTHLTRGAWCPVDPRECPRCARCGRGEAGGPEGRLATRAARAVPRGAPFGPRGLESPGRPPLVSTGTHAHAVPARRALADITLVSLVCPSPATAILRRTRRARARAAR
jgi:hypothetical protein